MRYVLHFQRHTPQEILLAGNGTRNIVPLAAFIAAAQQYHDHIAVNEIVDPVSRPHITPQFRHTFSTCLVIAGISRPQPVDTSQNGDFCLYIAQGIQLVLENIDAVFRKIVDNMHGNSLAYKLMKSSARTQLHAGQQAGGLLPQLRGKVGVTLRHGNGLVPHEPLHRIERYACLHQP